MILLWVVNRSWDLFQPPSCPVHGTWRSYSAGYLIAQSDLSPELVAAIDRVCHNFSTEMWNRSFANTKIQLPMLRHLVERGYLQPNGDYEETLLHHFMKSHHFQREQVAYLLSPEVGANINLPNEGGTPPLLEYLYYHIGDETDVEIELYGGEGAEEMAAEDWPLILEGVEFLLEHGADPLLADKIGWSALDHAEAVWGLSEENRESLLALMHRYI